MTVIQHTTVSNTSDSILYNAQIICKAFSDALDQNECSLKIPIGLDQEIRATLNTLVTLYNLANPPAQVLPEITSNINGTFIYNNPKLINPVQSISLADATKALKSNCLACNFGLPRLNISNQFSFSFKQLQLQLKLYTDIFDQLSNPNLCQAAFAFRFACLPDILKLLALLLSVYSAILAARKLGSISLSGFIKGVIGALLGKIIGSFNIQIDLSQTGIGCLLNALNEIADQMPRSDELADQLAELKDPNAFSTAIGTINDNVGMVDGYIKQLTKQTKGVSSDISNVFREVSDTVNQVVVDFNEQLGSIFGLLDYLQCEAGRSGSDFTQILEYMQKIVNIINLLSAIAALIAKKQVMAALCATKNSTSSLATVPSDILYADNTDLQQADLIAEYTGLVVALTTNNNGDIAPLIYNKEQPTILPKLDMYTCNLSEFIKAHTVDNITNAVLNNIITNQNAENAADTNTTPNNQQGLSLNPSNVNIRNSWNEYAIQYEVPEYLVKDPITGHASISAPDITTLNNNSQNAIETILNFVYNNPLDRVPVSSSDNTAPTTVTSNSGTPVAANTTKAKYGTATYTENEKLTFQNKCKDIDDVLNLLKNI